MLDDGDRRARDAGRGVAELEGTARAVLTGERTALNFVARLSGVATVTRRYVELAEGTGATILDTRKTRPDCARWRSTRCAAAAAATTGSGSTSVLVKENHLRIAGGIGPRSPPCAPPGRAAGRDRGRDAREVEEALAAGAERILLDNMSPSEVARAVESTAGRAQLEVSGGDPLATVRAYAETGVDFISVGALTHSARSLRVSLEVLENRSATITPAPADRRAARGGAGARAGCDAVILAHNYQVPKVRTRRLRRLAWLSRQAAATDPPRSSSAASTSWPRRPRSSRRRRPC